MDTKQKLLQKLYSQDISQTTNKPTYSEYETIVPGEGSVNATIMFIGEAPGESESKLARPFVGRSGKILREMLAQADISFDTVYITNIVKWRPPNNRAPSNSEIAFCFETYLEKEIEIIQPRILCTLGASALKSFLPGKRSMMDIRGKIYAYKNILLLPTIHPAFTRYNQSLKNMLLQDLLAVKELAEQKIQLY
jgi:DNA polymerase